MLDKIILILIETLNAEYKVLINQKIKDLAKEYLDVDFDIITKTKWGIIMPTDDETLKTFFNENFI